MAARFFILCYQKVNNKKTFTFPFLFTAYGYHRMTKSKSTNQANLLFIYSIQDYQFFQEDNQQIHYENPQVWKV